MFQFKKIQGIISRDQGCKGFHMFLTFLITEFFSLIKLNFVHSSLPIAAVSPNFWWFVFLCILTRRSSRKEDLFCYCCLLKNYFNFTNYQFSFHRSPKKNVKCIPHKAELDKEEPPWQKKYVHE